MLALPQSGNEQTCQFNEKMDIFQLKYEFDVEFDIPVTYPMTSPEIALPELDGKTAKVRNVSTWLGIPRSNSFFLDVQGREDLPNRPLQASVGQKCSKIWQVKVCLILTNFIMLLIAGIAHAMALGLGPWMAVEIPDLIEKVLVNRLYKVSHTLCHQFRTK